MSRIPLLAFLALLTGVAFQDSAKTLFDRGLKAHGQKDYDRAIQLYDRAIAAGNDEVSKRANYQKGLCFESYDPPRLAEAKAAYTAAQDLGTEKLELAGVDVYMNLYETAVKTWRETNSNNEAALKEINKDFWETKIKALGLGAGTAPGLIWAMAKEDSLVRDFAAEKLPEIVDAVGIQKMVEKVRDPNPTVVAGISSAIRRVLSTYASAKKIDDQADAMEKELQLDNVKLAEKIAAALTDADKATQLIGELITKIQADTTQDEGARTAKVADLNAFKATVSTSKGLMESSNTFVDKVNAANEDLRTASKAQIAKLRAEANEIRKNIPKDGGPMLIVMPQLVALIQDPNARLQARIEGVRISEELGDLQGDIVGTLLDRLKDDSSELRAECARALGAIKKDAIADRQRAADALQVIVQHEPEKAAEAGQEPDWKNNAFVRANAAFGLSRLGIVTATPSLIEALDDNDARVREASGRALVGLTGYEKIGYDADAPADLRIKSRDAWQAWWDTSLGVEVLIRRYRDFSNLWAQFDTTLFYDPEYFERGVAARALILYPEDAARRTQVMDAAQRVKADFDGKKNILMNEVVALGPAIGDRLITFVGGEFEGVKEPNPTVRLFVAQCLAEIAKKDGGTRDKVRKVLIASGGSPAKQVGAAFSIGMMGGSAGSEEKEALAKQGLTLAGSAVKEASARSLGMIRAAGTSPDIVRAIASLSVTDLRDERAVVAGCDALGRIKDAGAAEIEAIGKLASSSDSGLVREFACWALGEIGKSEGLVPLVKSRTDIYANVRLAARSSIRKIVAANEGLLKDLHAKAVYQIRLVEGVKNASSDERSGACLALGDATSGARYGESSDVVRAVLLGKGEKTPSGQRRDPQDPDPGVRAAAAEALGDMSLNAGRPRATVVRDLADALDDGSPEVRAAAWNALKRIGEKVNAALPATIGDQAYDATKDAMRAAAVQRMNEWATEHAAKFDSN